MSFTLIGQDCSISIYTGSAWTGSGSPSNPLAVQGFAKSIKVADKVNTIDVHGINDRRKKLRPTYGETQVTVELLVVGSPVVVVIGGYARVDFNPYGGSISYVGIWMSSELSSSADNAQTQTVTMDCDYA